MKLMQKIENLFVAITFAEAGEFDSSTAVIEAVQDQGDAELYQVA